MVVNNGLELEAAREAILIAALAHVCFDGWSDKAIAAGVAETRVRATLARLSFPGGPADMAEYYSSFADRRMVAALDADAVAKMRIRERIITVVRLRLTQAEGEREAVRALMNWLALPGHQALGMKCLYQTVDAMWRAIGDTSTDFNFYSKRAILAGVLAATVLYWLGDEGPGRENSFRFLERRIEDVMTFEKAKGRARKLIAELPDPFRILRDISSGAGKDAGDDAGKDAGDDAGKDAGKDAGDDGNGGDPGSPGARGS